MNRHRAPQPRMYVSAARLEELREEREAKRRAELDAALERMRARKDQSGTHPWKKA